jgi:hypothetical protein
MITATVTSDVVDTTTGMQGTSHEQSSESISRIALDFHYSLRAHGRCPAAAQPPSATPHAVHFGGHTHGLCLAPPAAFTPEMKEAWIKLYDDVQREEIAALRERLDHISKPRAADTARGLFAMVDDPTEAELKAFETLARASNYRTLRIATALIGLVEHAALDCGSDERHYIGRLLVRIGRKILHQVQER